MGVVAIPPPALSGSGPRVERLMRSSQPGDSGLPVHKGNCFFFSYLSIAERGGFVKQGGNDLDTKDCGGI
jgi:hypothetical protein